MLLLLIVGEITIIWHECCWVVLMMIIHALGVDKCVLGVKLLCFWNFCENRLKLEKFDLDEFEWINGVVVMN